MYHTIVIFIVRLFAIKRIWLYGGGFHACILLKNKNRFFKNTEFILRSCGEDIQQNKNVNYGHSEQERKMVKKYYKNSDYAWALSEEIKSLYQNKCNVYPEKIRVLPNAIHNGKANNISNTTDFNIGIIGRNHQKKRFDIAFEVAKKLPELNFIVKVPGLIVPKRKNLIIDKKTNITDLMIWPPRDVIDFYYVKEINLYFR